MRLKRTLLGAAFALVSACLPLSVFAQAGLQGGSTGINVTITPVIQNAAYVSGNCMGGFQTVAFNSSTSAIANIALSSKAGLTSAKEIVVFSSNPVNSTCTDKGTFSIGVADVAKVVWSGQLSPTAITGATPTSANQTGSPIPISSTGVVYVAIVETASETPASTSDLVLTFGGI